MARGGLLRAEYVTGILLDGFTISISLDILILILQMRKLRLRGLKGWTRSRRSEGVGCDWHLCRPDCKPGSHSTASLTLPASVRATEAQADGTGPPQGAGLWNECRNGGLGSGDPACHCSHNPLSPSCLRVPGLTPETPFGLPVFPAGGSQAYILSHQPPPPPPPVLAHMPLLPVGSQQSGCQRGQSSRALQLLLVPRVWARPAR